MDGAKVETEGATAAEIEDKVETPIEGADNGDQAGDDPPARDYEAEARAHGWTPKEEFRGDPSKWVDAEAFAKRADEVMPFLKKQNAGLKREIDDLKRQMKRSADFFSKAEERAYTRALADLQAEHDEAVDKGDVAGARKVLKALTELEKPVPLEEEKPSDDPQQARKEFAAWVEDNDWYVTDDKKRAYADIQAGAMGPANEWPEGNKAWLDELGKRVTRKFADKPPNPANPGGNRGNGAVRGAKTFSDLPAEAKAMCDKWVKQGLIKSREDYVKSYDWS